MRVRDEINQKYLKETIEVNAKNVKAKNDQIAAEKKRKAWGIFGAIVSAIVTIVATVATVMTCGAASPLGVLAIAGCTACLASSSLTIAAACVTDPVLKEKLQTAATILGIIGTLLTIISSVGAYNAAAKAAQKAATEGVMIEMADLGSQAANAGKVAVGAENAAQAAINGVGKWQAFKNLLSSICTVKAGAQPIPYLQTINAVFASITGVTSGVTNIINSANEMRLSELEKQLAEAKINQKKIDQEIAILSKAIEICSNNLQQCIQDILANEEKAAQTIQQMMDTSLKLDRQIGC
ncbi:MAG: type III secretion system translocon subunit SctE [Opitutales bacterium]|nr:type III secretion system translocon subunit SctE [Opitutales bacterium]